ncbi:hypothetical protein OBV_25120 [Oscillibacter valericigenes Sjm18-20]|nr:hypothetical protein OBV_25120 [Oscillibacter valericigenes Sjm18-20]
MTARDTLDALQAYLKEKVADQILLQREPEQGEESAPREKDSYVHPTVPIIRLPHQNFNPAGFQVPFLAVCFDSDDDGEDEHTMDIRLVAGVYGGGNYEGDIDPDGIPDNKGYLDLINLMEKAKLELLSAGIIGGACRVYKPVSMKIYDEDTWPCWFGNVTFAVSLPITPEMI